ncbi:MAG: hypothetical protein PHU71_07295, partial [Candidatus Gracilibacteria bacterium]|nr:hypothetical protein [Candidatus Gracilibacteria bacterium]
LPGECYTGFLSAETPKAWEKVLGFYKLISKKQLILLLSFAEKQGVLGTLKKSFYRTLRWQLYFGAEIPDAQHDKLQMLNEARNLENQNKQLANQDLEKIWQALGDKTEESTAVMIEYLRKDLEKSIDHSAAIPELMSLFCDKSLKDVQKMHVLEALLCERTFSNPVEKNTYKTRDYLAVMELFNACPLDRTLIMTYFYEHKDSFEELKAYLSAELEAFQDEKESLYALPYFRFQKNYRAWFMGSRQGEREKRTE